MEHLSLSMYQLVELKKAFQRFAPWQMEVDIDVKSKCMTITHKEGVIVAPFLPIPK